MTSRMEAVTIDDLQQDSDRVGIELVGADAVGLDLELRLNGSRFVDCRLSASDFPNSILTDVTFTSCILSGTSFRFARLLRVRFENCKLDETEFSQAKLREVVMTDCYIEATDFSNAEVSSLDLRSSQVISLQGAASLTNATVDSLQASALGPQLAQALGMHVKDDHVVPAHVPAFSPTSEDDGDEDVLPPEEALAQLAELRRSLTTHPSDS